MSVLGFKCVFELMVNQCCCSLIQYGLGFLTQSPRIRLPWRIRSFLIEQDGLAFSEHTKNTTTRYVKKKGGKVWRLTKTVKAVNVNQPETVLVQVQYSSTVQVVLTPYHLTLTAYRRGTRD
jgi:hypothetical protein